MKNKDKKLKKNMPQIKMSDLIYKEKVYNEKNEFQTISLVDEKILTI